MPKLLDNRLIGFDLADVATRSYSGAIPGNVLQVAANGQSLQLGPSITDMQQTLTSKEAELQRSGISLQQYLCGKWTDCTPLGYFTFITDIAYGAGRFVLVGRDANGPVIAVCAVSSGVPESGTSLAAPTIGWSIIHNSTSPILAMSSIPYLSQIIFVQNQFVLCGGNGGVLTSPDGYTWTQRRLGANNGNELLMGLAWSPASGYVFVGAVVNNYVVSPLVAPGGITVYSSDLNSFQTLATSVLGNTTPVINVTYGKNKFVAVGGSTSAANHIASSSDGVNWSIGPNADAIARDYMTVTYALDKFVLGTGNLSGSANIFFSADGINWTLANQTNSYTVFNINYGNGVFIAGDLNMKLSNDGINWSQLLDPRLSRPAGSHYYTACCYGNGLFLVGTSDGYVSRSQVSWEVFGSTTNSGGGGSTPTTTPTSSGNNTSWDIVGSMVLAYVIVGTPEGFAYTSGSQVTGNQLLFNPAAWASYPGSSTNTTFQSVTGTWRLLGSMGNYIDGGVGYRLGMWQKISNS